MTVESAVKVRNRLGMHARAAVSVVVVVIGTAVAACGPRERASDSAGSSDGGNPGAPRDAGVDVYKELVIVDSSVVLDARGSNATDGTWSFRRTMERRKKSSSRWGMRKIVLLPMPCYSYIPGGTR